jgi:hypothetical protein
VSPLLDARPLKLIGKLSLGTGKRYMRNQPHSIARHRIDSQPCKCHTLHGHCYAVVCPCPRHEGEIYSG